MKKLAHKIYRQITVKSQTFHDAYTNEAFYQVRTELFGIVIKISYKPVQVCDHSNYHGITT